MTTDRDVLVVGGGPAGISAACRIAEAGYTVRLCDSAPTLGGAIFRGASAASPVISTEHLGAWRELNEQLKSKAAAIKVMTSTSLVGLDSTGVAILKDCSDGEALRISPRAVIIATGAVESVRPVPGWHLPQVVTAGGLQINMKTCGMPPDGNIIIAGNGPLLLAIAAQLATLGNPPVAIIESGKPMLPRLQILGLPLAYMREALSYYRTLLKFGVPWIQGAHIKRITQEDDGLSVAVQKGSREITYNADIVALHNGLQTNSTGLPNENTDPDKGVVVVHAGDCHEALGARAAPASGRYAADRMLTALRPSVSTLHPPLQLRRQALAQARLKTIFQPVSQPQLQSMPDDTVMCRCEQKTIGDLRQLLSKPGASAKEIKLNGRFAMGRCQGRFCAKWTLELATEISGVGYATQSLTGNRWPVRPISIGALARLAPESTTEKPTKDKQGPK